MKKIKTKSYILIESIAILGLSAAVLYLNNSSQFNELESASASTEILFEANPKQIYPGQSVTLNWSAPNLSNVYIDQGVGPVANEGIEVVFPNIGDKYTLKGYEGGEEVTKSLIIKRQGN
ncbi:hypothetical protein KC669_00325 [Candidatus Dojkabacteria bacterium]|uniref:Uncharacterized protein n=1 Tax=Candidatus Dojkabacteria bacterium TaxID=2099670 RepID=A0A955LAC6_9BACT|nr:hypothetical protein [Candidatus Dojkabacteria bacterium]